MQNAQLSRCACPPCSDKMGTRRLLIRTPNRTHTHPHPPTKTLTHTYKPTLTPTYPHAPTHTHKHPPTHTHTHPYLHTHTHTHLPTHTHIHIHTQGHNSSGGGFCRMAISGEGTHNGLLMMSKLSHLSSLSARAEHTHTGHAHTHTHTRKYVYTPGCTKVCSYGTLEKFWQTVSQLTDTSDPKKLLDSSVADFDGHFRQMSVIGGHFDGLLRKMSVKFCHWPDTSQRQHPYSSDIIVLSNVKHFFLAHPSNMSCPAEVLFILGNIYNINTQIYL